PTSNYLIFCNFRTLFTLLPHRIARNPCRISGFNTLPNNNGGGGRGANLRRKIRCDSFCHSRESRDFFSVDCALFHKNTGGGAGKERTFRDQRESRDLSLRSRSGASLPFKHKSDDVKHAESHSYAKVRGRGSKPLLPARVRGRYSGTLKGT